jgi:hypothetical protein
MYSKPLTCYDLNVIQKKHPNFLINTSIASMVDLIVMKAESVDGDKLFTSGEDKIDLMGEETSIISEIANQMFSEIEDQQEAEKN